jgi:hypothetical protein
MTEENDEDNYDDEEHKDSSDFYKSYFKFDADAWDAWGKMLYDALTDINNQPGHTWYVWGNIDGWDSKKFPVNSFSSNTGKNKNFQYLGVNYFKEPVFKTKYFVVDPINITYVKHLQQHSVHFLQQPNHYKGLFDILN